MMNRLLVATALAVLVGGPVVPPRPVAATITPTADADAIAQALARDPASVAGARFLVVPPQGQPYAVSDSVLVKFPTTGPDYAILTTGGAALADDPNDAGDSGADDGGPNQRGDSDFDVSTLEVTVDVPPGTTCLSFDFRFLSEEHPEAVGSGFADAFIAELDDTTWTTAG